MARMMRLRTGFPARLVLSVRHGMWRACWAEPRRSGAVSGIVTLSAQDRIYLSRLREICRWRWQTWRRNLEARGLFMPIRCAKTSFCATARWHSSILIDCGLVSACLRSGDRVLLRNRREPDYPAAARSSFLSGYEAVGPRLARSSGAPRRLSWLLRALTYIGWAAARPELPDQHRTPQSPCGRCARGGREEEGISR